MRSRGTTLLELLIVMGVWSFIMVAVLGFYVYATKVNRRNDQMSAEIRAVQLVADKLNTALRYAELRKVIQFPPTVVFQRLEEGMPTLPGILLPNLRQETEFIGIAPDDLRAGPNAEPGTCRTNALYLGRLGEKGQPVMQLPTGLIAEMRVVQGMLLLSFNNPARSQPEAQPTADKRDPYARFSSTNWKPMNHYFQFRGLTSRTQFISVDGTQ